ncbi:uncharacterized protein [Macrobrachium rosenbergii]|uniref:uncharacterized protein n=1 Tax=Macrobrachium rosenbergii TaxID=79674 RepID=UPI0034D6194D
MKLTVLCVALCLGVVVVARPEGEASPVANPAPAQGEAVADPKPSEESPSEEEEAARRKRWYYYYPDYPYSFGYGYPWGFNYFSRSNFGPSVQGRTGSTPYTASFEELVDFTRRNDYAFHREQWLNHHRFNGNIPDVIDTGSPAAESRTRFPATPGNFNPNFRPDFNPNFRPEFNNRFNPNFFPNSNSNYFP